MCRRAAVVALAAACLLPGCAAARGLFTEPTGQITIERQSFIETYATMRVLYKRLRTYAQVLCERGELDCDELRNLDKDIKAFSVQIEKKIEVPESRIDWATVVAMLSALISLVP